MRDRLSAPRPKFLLSKLQLPRAPAGMCQGHIIDQLQQQSPNGGKKLITFMT